MYLKVTGCVIILFSCIAGGNVLAERYVKRYRQLLTIENLISYFEAEIGYVSTPVTEILNSIIKKFKFPFSDILKRIHKELCDYGYRPLSQTWREAIEEYRDSLALNGDDIEILIEFGNILGTTDKENQSKYFAVLKARLSNQINDAKDKKTKYTKLFNELGIIIGILVIILII